MKIKLNNSDIDIIEEEDPKMITDCVGQIDTRKSVIRVLKSLEKSYKEKVILHELVHYIHISYQITLSETEVDVFAHNLYDLIKNNPEFIKKIWRNK